jgi:hypothetical protein
LASVCGKAIRAHLLPVTSWSEPPNEAERLRGLYERRGAEWRDTSRTLVAVEDWLKHRPGGVVLEDAPPPSLKPGESLASALERARAHVDELRAVVTRVETAPWPSAYCKRRVRDQIETLSTRGRPDVRPLLERGGDVVWPQESLRSSVLNAQLSEGARGAIAMTQTTDMLSLTTWVLKNELLKRLDAEIDSLVDDDNALDADQREQKLADANTRLLEAERTEAALTHMAIEQRLPVEFGDLNPVAVLGVELVVSKTIASPGTSPEHVIRVVQSR